jgi:hypothetical protein
MPDLDLLNELSSAEDDFDVDLMACGCRLPTGGTLAFSVDDVLRLYNLDDQKLVAFVGALIDEANITPDRVFQLADEAARGVRQETKSNYAG